jgi:hypothetical protein
VGGTKGARRDDDKNDVILGGWWVYFFWGFLNFFVHFQILESVFIGLERMNIDVSYFRAVVCHTF